MTEPTVEHMNIARQMRAKARRGWWDGRTIAQLDRVGAMRWTRSALNPELMMSLQLSRDRGPHHSGWWRNAECECCWHLSIGARDYLGYLGAQLNRTPGHMLTYEEVPRAEVAYWSQLIFGKHAHKAWHEPGGTDPSLSPAEQLRRRYLVHLRVFLDPVTLEPIIPRGEVYTLTRVVPGLTPEKVDR